MHGRRTTHWSCERSHPLHQQLPVAPQREVRLHEPCPVRVGILRSLGLPCAVTETISPRVFLVIPPQKLPRRSLPLLCLLQSFLLIFLNVLQEKDAGFSFGTVRATVLYFPSADLTGAHPGPCSAAASVGAKCQTHIPVFVQQALCHGSPQPPIRHLGEMQHAASF